MIQVAQVDSEQPLGEPSVPLTRIAITLWRSRRRILFFTLGCMVLAGLISLIIRRSYTSTATLMPPEASALNPQSAISALNGPSISFGSSLTSQRTPGLTLIGILQSRTAQDSIVDRFNLCDIYQAKTHEAARAALLAHTTFDEDKKSGLISISVSDHDKSRARDMAQAYVDELNTLLNKVNSSSSHKEREFLEHHLGDLKITLDETSRELSNFSSKNGTVNPQGQAEALFTAETRLQGELAAAEADLSGLRAAYSDDNVRVKSALAKVGALRGQLSQMNAPATVGNQDESPSLRQLPILGLTYVDLSRRLAIEQAVYESLSKEFEMAKVQEAKELPVAREMDYPVLAESATSPHRKDIVLIAGILALFFSAGWIALKSFLTLLETRYGIWAAVKLLAREQEALAKK